MPRKTSKKSRKRKVCSNALKRSCRLRKNCTWKKSRGCRRKKSVDRMNKYEKVYRTVLKRTKSKKRQVKKTPKKSLNTYTKFVKENILDMPGTTQAVRMKQVAKLWNKQNKSKSPNKKRSRRICKKGVRKDGKCRKSPCKRGFRKGVRVCKKKPGPKSRSR